MAIDYSIAVDIDDSAIAISTAIVEKCHFRSDENDPTTFLGEGIVCHLIPVSDLGKSIMAEKFSISPKVKVFCRLDKFNYYLDGIHALTEISRFFLTHSMCDFVFLENGEIPHIIRRAGAVTISNRDASWEQTLSNICTESCIDFSKQMLSTL